ncbi:MAG TPA: PhzF family phenazine biosynthesis protein [Gemmatimonadales bacterium]|nr:PhzF family phenazine biosynthesis protein [Gemmatimonadales bacterium]
MGLRITQVDAFTNQPFAGNPAAVCILPKAAEPAWMLNVAREMNLAETAFLVRQRDGYDLRWFTPAVEVDLCGHATLASAHVLWEDGVLKPEAQARFHTKSGLLTADRRDGLIELDFPATPASAAPPPAGLIEAVGAKATFVGRSRFDYLVEVDSEATVRALDPDLSGLSRVEARGVIVTSRADKKSEFDFVSRFFAPRSGVPEDPVTGSAHCALTPYWSAKLGKKELRAFQASPRGGELRLRLVSDRVRIGGQAVTVLRGELTTDNMGA